MLIKLMTASVQRVNWQGLTSCQGNVPVSATKYPKPSYNRLRFEVRLIGWCYLNEDLHVQKLARAAKSQR